MKTFGRIFIVCALIVFAFSFSNVSGQFFGLQNPLVGEPAPDFRLSTLSKDSVSFSEYRNGGRAIVFFWATWCPHCRTALRDLSLKKDMIEQKQIKIALVDVGESGAKVESYLRKNNINLDVFLDKDSSVAEAYAVSGVPSFYYVDSDGTVTAVNHGLPQDLESLF
ncbi:MAG: TlpA disulfide reductase family protein [Candidatus Omnitrophica bacterium]|nr:TlpA disulfide reductase family protein [Candidatus Omnitrophota bacterium]